MYSRKVDLGNEWRLRANGGPLVNVIDFVSINHSSCKYFMSHCALSFTDVMLKPASFIKRKRSFASTSALGEEGGGGEEGQLRRRRRRKRRRRSRRRRRRRRRRRKSRRRRRRRRRRRKSRRRRRTRRRRTIKEEQKTEKKRRRKRGQTTKKEDEEGTGGRDEGQKEKILRQHTLYCTMTSCYAMSFF